MVTILWLLAALFLGVFVSPLLGLAVFLFGLVGFIVLAIVVRTAERRAAAKYVEDVRAGRMWGPRRWDHEELMRRGDRRD